MNYSEMTRNLALLACVKAIGDTACFSGLTLMKMMEAVIHNQPALLADITRLAQCHDDIAVLWLYGSRAKGRYHDHSDLDLAIAFQRFDLSAADKLTRPHELAMLWADELGITTDLISIVDINTIPAYLAFNVIEQGQILYQDDSPRAYKEANRIYSQYEYQMIENKYHDH